MQRITSDRRNRVGWSFAKLPAAAEKLLKHAKPFRWQSVSVWKLEFRPADRHQRSRFLAETRASVTKLGEGKLKAKLPLGFEGNGLPVIEVTDVDNDIADCVFLRTTSCPQTVRNIGKNRPCIYLVSLEQV